MSNILAVTFSDYSPAVKSNSKTAYLKVDHDSFLPDLYHMSFENFPVSKRYKLTVQISFINTGGYVVDQLVEALGYKPQDRGFDSRYD
jgi:hypothetical protein